MDIKESNEINSLFSGKYGKPEGLGLTAAVFVKGEVARKIFSREVSKVEVFKEAYILSNLERLGVDTSRVLQILNISGYWVMEMSRVRGREMLGILNEMLKKGDNDGARSLIEKMAELQARINGIDATGFPIYKIYAIALIEHNPSLSLSQKEKLLALIRTLPDGDRLCHGDLHPNNILVDQDGKLTAIDWPEVGVGDSRADAARTYADMCHPAFLFKGDLNLPDVYLNAYCGASGVSRDEVLRWMPVQAGMICGYKPPDFCAVLEKYLP